jgi:hypothetical protein
MVPECDQPAITLLANDAPLLSPGYAERWVCRWHERNAFAPTHPKGGERPRRHRPDVDGICHGCGERLDEPASTWGCCSPQNHADLDLGDEK